MSDSIKKRYSKKQLILIVVLWAFTAALMIIIWSLSSQESTQSEHLSSGVIKRIFDLFHITLSQHIVRKGAHAFEYMVLCLLFSASYNASFKSPQFLISFLSTALYASSDEIHQYFVAGRACQPRDVAVDCIGAAIGLLIYLLFWKIYKHHKREVK